MADADLILSRERMWFQCVSEDFVTSLSFLFLLLFFRKSSLFREPWQFNPLTGCVSELSWHDRLLLCDLSTQTHSRAHKHLTPWRFIWLDLTLINAWNTVVSHGGSFVASCHHLLLSEMRLAVALFILFLDSGSNALFLWDTAWMCVCVMVLAQTIKYVQRLIQMGRAGKAEAEVFYCVHLLNTSFHFRYSKFLPSVCSGSATVKDFVLHVHLWNARFHSVPMCEGISTEKKSSKFQK